MGNVQENEKALLNALSQFFRKPNSNPTPKHGQDFKEGVEYVVKPSPFIWDFPLAPLGYQVAWQPVVQEESFEFLAKIGVGNLLLLAEQQIGTYLYPNQLPPGINALEAGKTLKYNGRRQVFSALLPWYGMLRFNVGGTYYVGGTVTDEGPTNMVQLSRAITSRWTSLNKGAYICFAPGNALQSVFISVVFFNHYQRPMRLRVADGTTGTSDPDLRCNPLSGPIVVMEFDAKHYTAFNNFWIVKNGVLLPPGFARGMIEMEMEPETLLLISGLIDPAIERIIATFQEC